MSVVTLLDTVENDDVENNGIFAFIRNSVEEVPEYLTDIASLNLAYYYQHSGEKTVSPLVRHYLTDDNKLTTDSLNKISRILLGAYKVNWDKEYEALKIDYSPIENVDAYVTETTDRTGSGNHSETLTDTGTDNHSKTGTETLTQSGTDTTAKTGTETLTDKGTETTTKTGTDTLTQSGTDTNTKTGTESANRTSTDTTSTNTENHVEGTDNTDTYHHEAIKEFTDNPGGKSTTENSVYGYNSTTPADDSKSVTTVNQKVTTFRRTLSVEYDENGDPIKDKDGNTTPARTNNSDQVEGNHTETTTTDTTAKDVLEDTNKTTYDVTEKDVKDFTDTTKYNTTEETSTDKTDTTTYDTEETEAIDKTDTTSYNVSDEETLDLQHKRDGSESSTGKEEHALHRHGNIGVTTNQQMITEELELRKINFYDILFRDIDRYMTLAIY